MSRETKWEADGNTIAIVQPHTQAKHQIIESYVENLIFTLYRTGRRGITDFTFVDGFCGGGIYRQENSNDLWQGSPIRLINAVRKGFLRSKRTYDLDVKYIFIDANKNHISCLKKYAMPHYEMDKLTNEEKHHSLTSESGAMLFEQCIFINDSFENYSDACILQADIRKGHSFFLLDPFGYTDVSMKTIRKINSLGKSEILYTFMIDDLKRWVFSKHGGERSLFNQILDAEGYYEKAILSNMDQFGEQSYYRQETMRLFREKGQSKHVFTFSVIPSQYKNRVLYYLIHISSNLRALEVMKDSYWNKHNLDFEYQFEVYGYVFRSAEFYNENQMKLIFDVNQNAHDACISKLETHVLPLINDHKEGIYFRDVCKHSMEVTPANRLQYEQYIKQLRRDRYVIIYRDRKEFWGDGRLQNKDIIKISGFRQLSLNFF